MKKHLYINKPSQTEVEKYLKLYDFLKNYISSDNSASLIIG